MRGPSDCHAALRAAEPIGDALFAARKNEGERAGPEPRGEHRCITGEPKPQPGDHLTGGDEQQKWLSRSAALEAPELLDRTFIDGPTESVHRLCRISEHFSGGQMG